MAKPDRRWIGAAMAAALSLSLLMGCDTPETPTGPPSCEPARELLIERALKEGFRWLARADIEQATATFQALLAEEPNHPEAQDGLRIAAGRDAVVRPRNVRSRAAGRVYIGGQPVPVDLDVNTERLRFEERGAQRALGRALRLDDDTTPLPECYRQRTIGETAITPTDRTAAQQAIDLIVLHDSMTPTAREAFVILEANARSTHFWIDWDGAIYQALDLAWEANHAQIPAIDARSVAIDLVNPIALDKAPLPPEAAAAGVTRDMIDGELQGKPAEQWGYTEAQMTSLKSLVRALGVVLPGVPARVPRTTADDGVPREYFPGGPQFVGVVGHLHIFPRSSDPGIGFDWEGFADAIR